MHLTKFLPAYVGSKACWVEKLEQYRGRDFVEFFAGSAAISANLANRAVLNDIDPFLHKYFRQYESQPVVETFTDKDYFAKRPNKNWYRWLYYLQKMSFSGVYRWSKNGYNVPIKRDYKSGSMHLKDEVEQSIDRFGALSPSLHNLDYEDVPMPENPDARFSTPRTNPSRRRTTCRPSTTSGTGTSSAGAWTRSGSSSSSTGTRTCASACAAATTTHER